MNEYINTSFIVVGVLLSLVYAFLLVSYLAADKINKVLSALLVLMYSLAYFWVGGATINSNIQIRNFAEKMRETDIDFSWTRVMDLEQDIYVANGVVIAAYLLSLFFYFYVRSQKMHGRQEAGAA